MVAIQSLALQATSRRDIYRRISRGVSSVGRAIALQAIGQGFEPPTLHLLATSMVYCGNENLYEMRRNEALRELQQKVGRVLPLLSKLPAEVLGRVVREVRKQAETHNKKQAARPEKNNNHAGNNASGKRPTMCGLWSKVSILGHAFRSFGWPVQISKSRRDGWLFPRANNRRDEEVRGCVRQLPRNSNLSPRFGEEGPGATRVLSFPTTTYSKIRDTARIVFHACFHAAGPSCLLRPLTITTI